jgi:hypothetical protein
VERYFSWPSLVLSFLLAACAAQRPATVSLTLPPERLTLESFSFLPFDEPGWSRSSYPATTNSLILGKDGDRVDETKIIRVDVFSHPLSTESDEAFISYIQSLVERAKTESESIKNGRFESKDKRYEHQEIKVTKIEFQGRSCLQSFTISEDKKATKKTDNPVSMVLKVFLIMCKHPVKKMAVSLGYSERVYAGHEDPAFEEKALRLFEGLRFLP